MPQRAIIVGGGSVGSRVAAILGDYGHDPVVVRETDRDEQPRYGSIIHGDPTRPEIIDQADPERADAIAALTGTPETDHALCRRVRARAGPIRTVARGDPPSGAGAGGAADETVHATAAVAKAVASATLGYDQDVRRVPTSGFDLVGIRVDPRAPAADRAVDEVALPSGGRVVADLDATGVVDPGTRLRPDRRYLLAVEPGAADAVRNLLGGVR